jgi:hypothetical protein
MNRACLAAGLLALIGAFAPAIAEPVGTPCRADDAIPEFVTRRIELVSAVPAKDPGGAPAVELERNPVCHGGFGAGP